ncbi:hypothetical protein PTKIN_Ptkin13bG0234200 [Pterospermum kingtungense]
MLTKSATESLFIHLFFHLTSTLFPINKNKTTDSLCLSTLLSNSKILSHTSAYSLSFYANTVLALFWFRGEQLLFSSIGFLLYFVYIWLSDQEVSVFPEKKKRKNLKFHWISGFFFFISSDLILIHIFGKMKFGETFKEYLHGDQEWFLDKFSHVEYKRLKKVLKSCRTCKALHDSNEKTDDEENPMLSQFCQCQSCPVCDQMFFAELMREATDIAGCFSSRVRHLLHLHVATGLQRYVLRLRQCFKNDQQALIREGRMLIEYITMNAIAMRKILKKYDKVHSSVNGKNFKSKMRAEHLELLQSPWLIELGAFYLNFNGSDGGEFILFSGSFACALNATEPVMTLMLPNSIKLEYDLTCAVCLETVFNPYALTCGHLFCKSCACSAASVMIFQGLKATSSDSKCPICREGIKPSVHHLSVVTIGGASLHASLFVTHGI